MKKWSGSLKNKKLFWFAIVIFICVFCGCPYRIAYDFALTTVPNLFTTPLKMSVTSELCDILELGEYDARCLSETIYAYEFFDDFHQHYSTGITQKQVNDEIGKYLVACTDWAVAKFDGEVDQFCFYDFKGDGQYTLYFRFFKQSCDYPDSSIKDFCTYQIHSLPFNSFQCSHGSLWGPAIRTVEEYSPDNYFRERCKE